MADEEGLPFDQQANDAIRVCRVGSADADVGDRGVLGRTNSGDDGTQEPLLSEFLREIGPEYLQSGELLELRKAGIKVAIGSGSKMRGLLLSGWALPTG